MFIVTIKKFKTIRYRPAHRMAKTGRITIVSGHRNGVTGAVLGYWWGPSEKQDDHFRFCSQLGVYLPMKK